MWEETTMEFTATIRIEVPDEIAEFMGAGNIASALAANLSLAMSEYQKNSASGVAAYSDVKVAAPSGATFGLGWSSGPDKPAAARSNVVGTVKPTARAQALRSAHKTAAKRTGRPATLHDLEASDGGPVRESGPRSVESLQEQGIEVRELQSGAPASKSYVKHVKPAPAQSKPAVKKGTPPVLRSRTKRV